MGRRTESDEFYVLDLCDRLLGQQSSRQHRFEWLRGDYSVKRRSQSSLPVDGYWEELRLVVEFAERQHTEAVAIFDRRETVSGVSRGEQRKIYDQRRVDLIPANGMRLIVVSAAAFTLRRGKIVRNPETDAKVVCGLLRAAGFAMARQC